MPRFTITATSPEGRTRARTTELLYTHATARGGEIVGFHIDEGTAQRAAKRRCGTVVVPTVLDAKAQAHLAETRLAQARASLTRKGLAIGERALVVLPGNKHVVAEVLALELGEDRFGAPERIVVLRDAKGTEHRRALMFVDGLGQGNNREFAVRKGLI